MLNTPLCELNYVDRLIREFLNEKLKGEKYVFVRMWDRICSRKKSIFPCVCLFDFNNKVNITDFCNEKILFGISFSCYMYLGV